MPHVRGGGRLDDRVSQQAGGSGREIHGVQGIGVLALAALFHVYVRIPSKQGAAGMCSNLTVP